MGLSDYKNIDPDAVRMAIAANSRVAPGGMNATAMRGLGHADYPRHGTLRMIRGCVVEITGAASGGGKYTGRVLTGNSTFATATSNTTGDDYGTEPSADNCYVFNADEIDQSTHQLKTGSLVTGILRNLPATDGKPVILVSEGPGKITSPSTLGAASEGSETASSDTWTRSSTTSGSNYGDSPLDLYVVCRVVYNELGDEKLYCFSRKLSFDARGLLISVGAETRVEVDAPDACA